MTLFISTIAFVLVVCFLCSLSEATLLSLTPGEVANLSERHPRMGAIWSKFKSMIERPIGAILIVNTIAQTAGSILAGAEFERIWRGKGLLIFSIGFTFCLVIFTEFLPKTLGVEYRRRLAYVLGPPINFLIKLFHPLTVMLSWTTRPFTKGKVKKPMTLENLRSLAAYARLSQEIGPYQEKIIKEASRLAHKNAGEIMIPAGEIIYFDDGKSMEDLIVRAHLDPHTRFPMCINNDINQILGYINFKELLFLAKSNPTNPNITGIIRPVRFIPPNMPLSKLLRTFIEEHIHIAIVQSEANETLGLVTLEDIIEEFLGDIEDEFDRLPKMFHPLSGGVTMVGGGVLWWDLAKRLEKPLEPFDGTLSEWLMKRAKKSLKPNDTIAYADLDFIIRRIRRGKVFEVTIVPHGTVPPQVLPKAAG